MINQSSNTAVQVQAELSDNDLDAVAGGKATYYEMGGNWYIVGHDKHGHSTGAVRIT